VDLCDGLVLVSDGAHRQHRAKDLCETRRGFGGGK
jgi:hypothetical protein